jgi:type II secretory pathway component GspD/PulD (secretin)
MGLFGGDVDLVAQSQSASGAGPLNITAPTPPPAPQLHASSFTVFTDYGMGNAIANALRNAPAKLYTFDRASLRDVLRFLAEDAGIPFISMQERMPAGDGSGARPIDDTLVTFTMRASPFLVLESIAKANDIALIYENGVWFIRPYNERELIGRIYRLKYTPQDRITYDTSNLQSSQTSQTGDLASVSIPNMQLQQPQSIFKVEEPALVQEIKTMLKIPNAGVSGKVAPSEASVGDFPPIPSTPSINPVGSNISGIAPAEAPSEPTVTYNSDTNTIYIVATRQQHQWVEGFLVAADRPQALIGIEVKFFETTRDPSKEFGINWANTMQGGYNIQLSQQLVGRGGVGFDVANERNRGFDRQRTQENSGGNQIGIDQEGNPPFDFTRSLDQSINRTLDIYNSLQNYEGGLGAAYTAVLSPRDIDFAIEAFMEDRDTSIVQYPRVLTVNNREVAISNARNEPILGSSTTNASTGSSTQSSGIEYLPIGTQLNILPKTMPDGSVFLNVAITVSNIIGQRLIETGPGQVNEYPITTSRIYQSALQVDSGYTLAVGGLEEAFDEQRDNGILLLKDIPAIGYLFKSKGRSQNKRNLIVFITPTVIQDRRSTAGISESPEAVIPVRPGDPSPPAFGTDGALVGGIGGLEDAFAWLSHQNMLFEQISFENRVSRDSLRQLEGVIRTAEMIVAEIENLGAKYPDRATQLAAREETALDLLEKLKATLEKSRRNLF